MSLITHVREKVYMAKIDSLFMVMLEQGASDLHLVARQKPVLRVHGELERLTSEAVLQHSDLQWMLFEITPQNKQDEFELSGDVDFAYELAGAARFRANFFRHKYGCGAVFRKIPTNILPRMNSAFHRS